jgi:hypothetical protein
MKNLKKHLRFLIPILLVLYFYACQDKIDFNNSDNGFPIELRMEVKNGTVLFNWDVVKAYDFKGYTLVRSEMPILTGKSPSLGVNTIIFKSLKADSVKIEDNSLPFFGTYFYYKLYVDLGDRFIESQTLTFFQPVSDLISTTRLVYVYPDTSLAVLYSINDATLTLFDYKNHIVIANKSIGNPNQIGYPCMTGGIEDGKRMLYLLLPFEKLYKFEIKDFIEVASVEVDVEAFSMVKNGNQLFLTHSNNTKSFSVRKVSDLSVLINYPSGNATNRRVLYVLDTATNQIAEITPTKIISFNVNKTSGQVTNVNSINIETIDQNFSVEFVPSSVDKKYFIPKIDGQVYDTNLNPITDIILQKLQVDHTFSFDGKFLYSVAQSATPDNSTVTALIVKYNFPEMTFVSQKVLIGVVPQRIQATEDGVVFFGTLGNYTHTVIKNIYL